MVRKLQTGMTSQLNGCYFFASFLIAALIEDAASS
jgi:hypothetical protein